MNNEQNSMANLGYREMAILGEMLILLSDVKFEQSEGDRDFNGLTDWGYNPNSDYMYLLDEDYNCLMVNDNGKLENWDSCLYCGAEGFRTELKLKDGYCDKDKCQKQWKSENA